MNKRFSKERNVFHFGDKALLQGELKDMSFEDQDKLIQAENRLIKMVYATLDKTIRNASERLSQERRKVSKYKSERPRRRATQL